MIDKHHVRDYTGGVPYAAGDRYYSQDLFRDAWYSEDRTGHILKDLVPAIPFIVTGGAVTKGTGDTLNITLGVGYAKYSVTVPNSFASTPPTTQSQDIEAIRVEWEAQTNMAIGSAVLDGATTNYVKVRYNESDGNSRQRAKKAGTYVFEKTPSYTIVVDDTPNADYDILLNTFTGTGGGAFTFTGVSSQQASRRLEINDANYTMLDTDGYNQISFDGLSADRALYLPTLADNQNRESFYITNLDGSYDVIVTPEGTDDINDWNDIFPITEKYGTLKITPLSDRWLVEPIGDACIYEVSSETADTGLALDGTWDDVSGMILLNGVYGVGDLYAFANLLIADISIVTNIVNYWGIGKTSGNNTPDIKWNRYNGLNVSSQNLSYMAFDRQISKYEYESDGSTIYMKSRAGSDELNVTTHTAYGDTDCPMYLKWIRKY